MYCSLDDLKKKLPERILLQLADDQNEGEFVGTPPNNAYMKIVEAIENADTLINGYVSGRYTLPFATVPKLIKNISVNLAICELYERSQESVLPEAIVSRRKDNVKILERLQEGKIVLPGFAKEQPYSGLIVNKTDDDREWPDSLLSRF